MYLNFFKPAIDCIIAFVGLAFLSPLLIVISVAVLIDNKGSLLFFQERPGKNEKIFSIIKIKTMTDKRSRNGELLPNDQRLTPLGRFLRRYSLDEIPQLINVIKGDMSLVGPRPLHVKYLSVYNKRQARRHEVKGGITGWAQINGRNKISWEEKFELDLYYVENISFALDLKILWSTLLKVIRPKDVNSSRQETMPSFTKTENGQ